MALSDQDLSEVFDSDQSFCFWDVTPTFFQLLCHVKLRGCCCCAYTFSLSVAAPFSLATCDTPAPGIAFVPLDLRLAFAGVPHMQHAPDAQMQTLCLYHHESHVR